MSRYIDADLIEYHDSFTNDGEYARVAFGDDIDVLPTADVVEVIPCKNCFYSKPYNAVWHLPLEENNLWCSRYEEEKEKDWFCADAIERTVKHGEIH